MDRLPLISIIIPVYNTKEYLYKCLDSVRKQTYSNLEIICVDDGSIDGCEKIVDEYANLDRRFKVVHKENGGESSARNVGLKMATGDYWTFMDCDDWIESDMYKKLVDVAVHYKVDIVAASWFWDAEGESIKIDNKKNVAKGVFDKETLLKYVYQRDYYRGFSYMWNKIYKKELFFDGDNRLMLFPEDLKIGGDVYYLARLVLNANTAYYIDESFYHYIQRKTSGGHTMNLKSRMDWIEAYKRIIAYIETEGIETEALLWIKRFLVYHSSNTAEMALEQKDEIILNECQKMMRQYENEYRITNIQYPDRIQRYEAILEYTIEN